MRRLKSRALAVFVLGALLTVWAAARAQESDRLERPQRPDLGLSDEQKEQVKQIRNSQREQLGALRQDTSLSPEEKRAKAQEIRKNTRAQMDSVLTAEQKEKLQQLREERRDRRGRQGKRGGRRGPAGTPPPDVGSEPQ